MVQVLNAFNTSLIHFGSNKQFSTKLNESNYLYDPSVRVESFREEYNLLRYRITHNKTHPMELSSLDSIRGNSSTSEFIRLFGMLSRNPLNPSQYVLHELNNQVVLDLSATTFGSGLFAEGMFVVVEGVMNGSVFSVESMEHPPAEERSVSLSRLHEVESSDPTNAPLVVIVSSMYLDESDTLATFEKILTKYAQLSPSPLFLLCGDFVSPSFSFDSFGLTRLERLFSSLAALLASFPQLVQQSQFVFVPGPRDIGCNGLFPREPIPQRFVRSIRSVFKEHPKNLVFTSNPSRIRVGNKEICICREDLSHLTRESINKISLEETDVYEEIGKTIVSQARFISYHTLIHSLKPFVRLIPLPHLVNIIIYYHIVNFRTFYSFYQLQQNFNKTSISSKFQ